MASQATRSNANATSDLHSHRTRHMASHENTAQARRNIGTESAGRPSPITKRLAAGEYATTIGDHQFSRLTCTRVPCARNGGKIEAGFHSRRSLPSPACPSQRISFRRTDGNWGTGMAFFFDPGCGGHRGPAHSNSVTTDKLGSVMPAVNVASPNLKRTIPSVRSKTD